jgi:hypothetical protein
MTQYTLTLTETAKGFNDHGRYASRRAIARARAIGLGYLIISITEPTPGGYGRPGVFRWVVDDQGNGSLNPQQDLRPIFEYFGYVTVS